MKAIISIILSVFIANSCFANKIDSLKTKKDVNAFLVNKIDTFYKEYKIFCDSISQDCRSDSFYKVDINGDGLNDLIVDGRITMMIIDKGYGKYERLGVYEDRYLNTIKLDNANALVYYDTKGRIDTIIYKYGKQFVYHVNKQRYTIHKLYYSARGCYGGCPVFNIEIHEDGSAFFDAVAFNEKEGKDEKRGKFVGRISDSMLKHSLQYDK